MKAAKSEGLGLWTRRGGGLEAFSSTPPQSSRGCQGRASGEEGDKEASAERSAITKEEQESYQEEREVQSALGEGDSRHGIGRSGLRPDEDGSGPEAMPRLENESRANWKKRVFDFKREEEAKHGRREGPSQGPQK